MNILCGNCRKESGVKATRNEALNALNLKKAGFIAKFPVLLGLSEWMFTCSPECHRELLQQKFIEYGITEEDIQRVKDDLEKIKEKFGL